MILRLVFAVAMLVCAAAGQNGEPDAGSTSIQDAARLVMVAPAIVFGAAFELTIEADESFDHARLSPLVVELLEQTPSGARVYFRYRARCLQPGEVTLALDPPRTLMVLTSLPDPAGELEWPSDGWQLAVDGEWLWWPWALTGVLVGGLLVAWRRRRSRSTQDEHDGAGRVVEWDALAALQALSLPSDGRGVDAFYAQLKAIVRRHCAVRFALAAHVRTSEEIVAELPALGPALQPWLGACDLVLFGNAETTAERATEAHEQLITFVTIAQVSA